MYTVVGLTSENKLAMFANRCSFYVAYVRACRERAEHLHVSHILIVLVQLWAVWGRTVAIRWCCVVC